MECLQIKIIKLYHFSLPKKLNPNNTFPGLHEETITEEQRPETFKKWVSDLLLHSLKCFLSTYYVPQAMTGGKNTARETRNPLSSRVTVVEREGLVYLRWSKKASLRRCLDVGKEPAWVKSRELHPRKRE